MTAPTQKDLKNRFGDSIPDEPVEIEEVPSLSMKNDGTKNIFVGIIDKFEVWKKTSMSGAIISIVIIAYDIIGIASQTVEYTISTFKYLDQFYEEVQPFIGEIGEKLIVFLKEPAPGADDKWPTQFGTITAGTSVIPVSGNWGIDINKYC